MWRVHTDVGVTTNSLSELCQLVTFLHSLSNINASKVVIYLYTLLYCAYSDYLYRLQELFSRQFLIDLLFFLYLLNVKFDCLLCRENLQLLRQRYYYATWKADGTRYMMLITMDGCYLIDRSFNFRRVQMRFPCRITNDVWSLKQSYPSTPGVRHCIRQCMLSILVLLLL